MVEKVVGRTHTKCIRCRGRNMSPFQRPLHHFQSILSINIFIDIRYSLSRSPEKLDSIHFKHARIRRRSESCSIECFGSWKHCRVDSLLGKRQVGRVSLAWHKSDRNGRAEVKHQFIEIGSGFRIVSGRVVAIFFALF